MNRVKAALGKDTTFDGNPGPSGFRFLSTSHSPFPQNEFVSRFLASLIAGFCLLHGIAILGQGKEFPLTMENLAVELPHLMTMGSGGIEFQKAGTYKGHIEGEAVAWGDEGTYTIRNDQVELKPTKCFYHYDRDVTDCDQSLGHAFCKAHASPNDLYYAYTLRCTSAKNRKFFESGSMDFVFPQTAVPAGAKRMFNGRAVVIIGKQGSTTNGVKIRKTPFLDGEDMPFYFGAFCDPTSLDCVKPFVPAGTSVTVIARTENKEQVKNWNNCWYLVNVGFNREVWMFAEFVKLDK